MQAAKRGYIVIDNNAEGDCQFESLAHQLKMVLGVAIGSKDLRKKIVDHIECNPCTVSYFVNTLALCA